MRFPRRRFREERAHVSAAEQVRTQHELQRAHSYELYRNPPLPLR